MVRATDGISMRASATPAAKAEKCPIVTTTHDQTKMPITMEGIPFMTSVTKRTAFAARLRRDSAR